MAYWAHFSLNLLYPGNLEVSWLLTASFIGGDTSHQVRGQSYLRGLPYKVSADTADFVRPGNVRLVAIPNGKDRAFSFSTCQWLSS